MANVQIPNLGVAISLSGTEEVEVVQSGTSRRATTQQIANLYTPTTITAAGSNTQVQFNDGGLLNGNADFTFDKTTSQIAIAAGSAAAPTLIPTGDANTGIFFPAADTIAFAEGGAEVMRIDSSGNVGIGTSTFGTSAVRSFAIATGTAPTTGPADTIQIYSTDLSAGNTMLSLYTEGTVVNSNVTAAATHRIAIRVNGTVYYLLANTSA
jgi:hypothetical protein